MGSKRLVHSAALGTAMAGMLSVGVIGGIGFAAPGAVPDKDDGTVNLCYTGKQARNKDGGAVLRIYDSDKNGKKCLDTDSSLKLQTRPKLVSGQMNLPANFVVTDTSFTDVTNFVITLPSKGTFLVDGFIRARLSPNADNLTPDCSVVAQLATPGGAIAGTERMVNALNEETDEDTEDALEGNASWAQIVTTTAATAVRVQVKQIGSDCTSIQKTIGSDANGRSYLTFVRIAN